MLAAAPTVTEEPGGLRIVVPTRRAPFTVLFLGAWLLMAGAMLWDTAPRGAWALLGWLLFWVPTSAGVLCLTLWSLFGQVVVTVSERSIAVRYEILGRGRGRTYDLARVRNLRPGPNPFHPFQLGGALSLGFWGLRRRSLEFDHAGRTVRFGAGLEDDEAHRIADLVTARFHIPGDAPGGP